MVVLTPFHIFKSVLLTPNVTDKVLGIQGDFNINCHKCTNSNGYRVCSCVFIGGVEP